MRIDESNIKKWEKYKEIIVKDKNGNSYIINMKDLVNDIERARIGLCHKFPPFTEFISKLEIVYTFQVDTMATDGNHIFINPLFAQQDLPTLTDKAFVIAHEVMHCVLSHMRRATQLGWNGTAEDHQGCNISADYEVNVTLCDMGLFSHSVPQKMASTLGICYDKKYSGWSFEKIHKNRPSAPKHNQPSVQQSQQSKQSQNQKDNNKGNSGSGSGQTNYSEDYKKGWAKAIEDYKKGKLKL